MPFIGTRFSLNNTCTVQRETITADSLNRKVSTFSTLASNVRCRLIQKSKIEFFDGKRVVVSQNILYLPFGQSINEKDRVVIGSITYSVESVDSNPGNSSHHVEAVIQEVKS